MNLTPEQAREKWCPMVRIARRENTEPNFRGTEVVVAGCNTDALGRTRVPKSCRCIADDCAMWRWAAMDGPLPDDAEPGRIYVATRVRSGMGYCGLAGRPEVTP